MEEEIGVLGLGMRGGMDEIVVGVGVVGFRAC